MPRKTIYVGGFCVIVTNFLSQIIRRSSWKGQHCSYFMISEMTAILSSSFVSLCTAFRIVLIYCYILRRAGHDGKMASGNVSSASLYHNSSNNSNNIADHSDRTDRPIRPLPKRRLRERLSPEVADSIKYPPASQSAPALFSYPCNLKGSFLEEESSAGGREFHSEFSGRQASRRNGAGAEGDPDEVTPRTTVVPRPPTESLGRPSRGSQKPEISRQGHSPQPPPSAASSADGYDSFENTNNKKKRKIPTAGEMNGGHGLGDHGLNDSHSLPGGLAVTPDRSGGENGNSTSVPYYGSGSFVPAGQNISGPGRGRFGRARNGRSPLQTLSDASGNWLGRGTKTRSATWSPQPGEYLPAPVSFYAESVLRRLFLRARAFPSLIVLFTRHVDFLGFSFFLEFILTLSLFTSAKHWYHF